MSRRLTKSTTHDQDGVDMTPMLDIVFILLIFFIVTATFLDETGVDFTQPDRDGSTGNPPIAIRIVIDSADEISVEGRVVSLALVESEVQRYLVNRPDAVIDLSAAEDARLMNVVSVKDQMEQAGRSVRFETYSPATVTASLN